MFRGSGLVSISIPSTITFFGNHAFQFCLSLSLVQLSIGLYLSEPIVYQFLEDLNDHTVFYQSTAN